MSDKPPTTTVRVKISTHDILRYLSYKLNKSITEILEETFIDKGPSISEKIGALAEE